MICFSLIIPRGEVIIIDTSVLEIKIWITLDVTTNIYSLAFILLMINILSNSISLTVLMIFQIKLPLIKITMRNRTVTKPCPD